MTMVEYKGETYNDIVKSLIKHYKATAQKSATTTVLELVTLSKSNSFTSVILAVADLAILSYHSLPTYGFHHI